MTELPEAIFAAGAIRIAWHPAVTNRPLNFPTPDKANWLLAGTKGWARANGTSWSFTTDDPTPLAGMFGRGFHVPADALTVDDSFVDAVYDLRVEVVSA